MKHVDPHILTINGGSSSIKFAVFEAGGSLRQILEERMVAEAVCRVLDFRWERKDKP